MRTERVIDREITAAEVVQAVPPGSRACQLVIERRHFENASSNAEDAFSAKIYVDGVNGGGCTWAGGRSQGRRPGQRMLWSFLTVPLPPGAQEVRIEVTSPVPRRCEAHVDFL